jgi:integrase
MPAPLDKTKPFEREFGPRAMSSITRKEAQAFAERRPNHARAVQAMFSDAFKDEIVEFNPFIGAHAARSRGRKDIEVISHEKLLELAEKAEDLAGRPFNALVLLAGLTAMREGETFGLAIEDFDIADESVLVAWQFRTKTNSFARPKNKESRTVYVPPLVMDAVRPLLVREVGTEHPRRPDGGHILLLTPTGKHFTARTHHYYWRQVRAAAGVPAMQFHELKHFAASYFLNELELDPHHIAHQIAHRDLDLLFELYGHPSERKAREAFKRAFHSNVRSLHEAPSGPQDAPRPASRETGPRP